MVFRGIDDAQARADLIAFLEIAGRPGGGEKAVAEGLLPAAWLSAGAPELIRDAPPAARVTAMRHCGDSYVISTGDGRETPYWEKNIDRKSVVEGKSVSVRLDLGGRRSITQQKQPD